MARYMARKEQMAPVFWANSLYGHVKRWRIQKPYYLDARFYTQSYPSFYRGVTLKQKQAAMLAVCAILLFCVAAAGCTSSTSSSSNATNVSTTTTSAQASTSASIVTPSASASASATSAKLTVLFFYSPTCPYCQALESTSSYHQLENTSKITFTPIVSATSPLTDQYNVTTIPTLILLNHGTEVGRWVDATDANGINAQIASLLNPS